jgi:hypothetical protein
MAHYTVTPAPVYDWEEPHGSVFKYRYPNEAGEPPAQAEFDRRHAAGQHAVLTQWDKNEPKIMERC